MYGFENYTKTTTFRFLLQHLFSDTNRSFVDRVSLEKLLRICSFITILVHFPVGGCVKSSANFYLNHFCFLNLQPLEIYKSDYCFRSVHHLIVRMLGPFSFQAKSISVPLFVPGEPLSSIYQLLWKSINVCLYVYRRLWVAIHLLKERVHLPKMYHIKLSNWVLMPCECDKVHFYTN